MKSSIFNARRLLLGMALLYSLPVAALVNGDFSTLDVRAAGTVGYTTTGGIGFLPSWTILSEGGASIVTGAPAAFDGTSMVRFNTLTTGFGANKLDQCMPIDAGQAIALSYRIRTDADVVTDDYRFRVNPTFYVDMETCERDLQANVTTNRLAGEVGQWSNADWDIRFATADITANVWNEITNATHVAGGPSAGAMVYSVESIPADATALRLSLRARSAVADANIWFDDVRVEQSATNMVRNGSFEHIDLFDGSFLAGTTGWQLSRDGDATLRAAAGAAPQIATQGQNLFYLDSLTGNFGGSSLNQCAAISGTDDIQPSLFAMSYLPDVDLNVRVNVDFFTDANCTVAGDSALRLREDFAVNGASGQWMPLSTAEIRLGSALGGIQSALISVRARDRSGPDTVGRTLYMDDVQLVAAVPAPTFSPSGQNFSAAALDVVINGPVGSTIFYTLDGSDPDITSLSMAPGGSVILTNTATVRAVAYIDPDFSAIRSATYTKVALPFVPPTGPLNRSTGSLGMGVFGLLGLALFRRRLTVSR